MGFEFIVGGCKEYMDVKKVPTPLQDYQVDLYPVLELIVCEQRLHKVCSQTSDQDRWKTLLWYIQTVRFKCVVINYYLRLNVWLCIVFGPM